jgi:hypothetical protein
MLLVLHGHKNGIWHHERDTYLGWLRKGRCGEYVEVGGIKWQGVREKFITWSFIISALHYTLLENQLKKDSFVKACDMYGADEKCLQNFCSKYMKESLIGRSRRRCKNINMNFKEARWESGDTIYMKFRVFWDILTCRAIIDLMKEAARTSETSVEIYLITRQCIPEYSELHTRRRENLKSHKICMIQCR